MTGFPFKNLSQISGYLCIDFQRRARTEKWTLDVFFWQVLSGLTVQIPLCRLVGTVLGIGRDVPWRCQAAFIGLNANNHL